MPLKFLNRDEEGIDELLAGWLPRWYYYTASLADVQHHNFKGSRLLVMVLAQLVYFAGVILKLIIR